MKFKNSFLNFFVLISIYFFTTTLQAATITPNIFTDPTVNPPGQPGDCSLRYAIQSINNGVLFAGCTNDSADDFGMNDTIVLQAGTYVLTIPGNNEDDNETGDLDVIDNDISIIGAGSDQTSIDASGIPDKDRVIQFIMVENAAMTGVMITGGDGTVLGDQFGGGIDALTIFLNLTDVQLIGNKSNNGGGISVSCQPTIVDSVIQGNMAILDQFGGQGGGIFLPAEDLLCDDAVIATVDHSIIANNNAEISGGGIYVNDGRSLNLMNSTVDNNDAELGGGGIGIDEGVVSITNSTISRNQVFEGDGGGIEDFGFYLFLTNSTVSNNSAIAPLAAGGGGSGGGIWTLGGLKGLYNVTIAFNDADNQGGGIFKPSGQGQGDRFPMEIFNTIIARNTAPEGPDCFGPFQTGGFNLIGDIGAQGDCTNFQNNVSGDQVGQPGSVIDPQLGDLQLNGGTTETHALALTSPAVDMGNPQGCQSLDQNLFIETFDFNDIGASGTIEFIPLDIDQRFFTRPIAILDPNVPVCDIGAFELQTFNFQVTKDDGLGGATIEVGDSFTYTIVMTNNGPGDASDVTLSDPLPSQVSFVSLTTSQGSCAAIGDVVSCDLGDVLSGASVTVTVTVIAVAVGDAVNTATVTTSVGDFVATVTTTIGGLFVFGSGFHCALHRGGPAALNAIPALLLFTVLAGLGYGLIRRRAKSH
jgi:uncharacterized repeat protein (TIGR01451 family)